MSLLVIAIGYVVFKFGGGPTSVFWVEIVITFITGAITLEFGRRIVGINPWLFIRETTLPVVIPFLVSLFIGLFVQAPMSEGWGRLFVVSAISMIPYTVLFWLFGVQKAEKEALLGAAKIVLQKSKVLTLNE